jgi:hypothetical protein
MVVVIIHDERLNIPTLDMDHSTNQTDVLMCLLLETLLKR